MSHFKNLEKKIGEIEKHDDKIGSFLETCFEDARKKAKKLDAGGGGGKLAGKVFSLKNNIAVKGMKMTCASKMLENYTASYSATVVERLLKEGAVLVGSVNLDEFACGSDCMKSALTQTRNPNDLERVVGGSSGGSAASVSANFCDFSLGSDTGGSIRCPSSFCGVVGFKPSYGLVSRFGLADLAMSFDQIGPIAKSVDDAAKVLEVIAGEDEKDQTTFGTKTEKFSQVTEEKVKIGVPKEFFDGCDEQVEKIVRDKVSVLEKQGCQVVDVSIPISKYAVPIYYVLVYSEFASAMQKYDGLKYGACADLQADLTSSVSKARSESLGDEVKRRILLGTFVSMKEHKNAWLTKALKARDFFKRGFDKAFEQCDVLIGPTMPILPWKVGEKSDNPLEMYLTDVLTAPANICGIPAGSVPAGKVSGLPVGLQVMGRWGDDAKVLGAMKSAEK